jgi:DNA-binding response OmpR family regulator
MSVKKIVLAEDNTTLSLLLKFRIEKEAPDLILTDIMMPFVSGLEVISYVRLKLDVDTPIIVFSSAGQEEMVLKAFNLGANDFMGKPFSPNELIIRVKRLLN